MAAYMKSAMPFLGVTKPARTAALRRVLLEHLVTAGAWWDLVDEVAGHHVAPLHRAYRVEMAAVLRDLAHRDPDWVRAYLLEQGDVLSPLSRREAAKNLVPSL